MTEDQRTTSKGKRIEMDIERRHANETTRLKTDIASRIRDIAYEIDQMEDIAHLQRVFADLTKVSALAGDLTYIERGADYKAGKLEAIMQSIRSVTKH